VINALWVTVYAWRFIKALKWRMSGRKLTLISEREIGFIGDEVVFSHDDLLKPAFKL
jgi:hypothetical protein